MSLILQEGQKNSSLSKRISQKLSEKLTENTVLNKGVIFMSYLTAIKVVMSFSFDSEKLKKSFPKEYVEQMIKEKFYGATILFSTGIFEGKAERSAQLIVWYRNNWRSGGANKIRNYIEGLKNCVRIGLKLGQQSTLIEISFLGKNADIFTQLYEIKNRNRTAVIREPLGKSLPPEHSPYLKSH